MQSMTESNGVTDIIAASVHADKLEPSCMCTVCEKRFTTRGEHAPFHRRTHGAGDCQVYRCTECDKKFAFPAYLHRHMNIHRGKYKCAKCGRCCQSNRALAEHVRTHSGEKPFQCTDCGQRFSQKAHFVVHSRRHTGETPYQCHMCTKAFSRSGSLRRHLIRHEGQMAFECCILELRLECICLLHVM